MRKCLLLLALIGCGDNTPSSDATIAITDGDGTATSAVTIDSTLVGQSASTTVHVKNAGTGATGPIAISFQGAAARDYSLDDQLTTCTGRALGPQEACDVAIVFRPTEGGDRYAMLVINSNPGGTATVDLDGTGTMADLHWTPTAGLDFGQMEMGSGISTTVWLYNDGAVAAPIDSITTTTPGYGLGGNTCGTVLPAGSSCVVFLLVSPATVGANNGMLNVVSSGQTYSTPLLVHGARRITLVTTNVGMIATGTVSSSPAGLACGPNSTCTALFETDVLLTAVPGAVSAVGSWSVAGCGTATTCNVAIAPTPITVTVTFVVSNAGLLNITFAGTGTGRVRVVDGSITNDCTSDCTLPITPGNTILVLPATPSKFGGMTGACPVMPDSDLVSCSFTAPMGTSNLGVTFDKYPNELWTRVLGANDALHVEYDGSGNVIVAYGQQLTKLSPTGTTLWTLSMSVLALAVGPGDSDFIYVAADGGITKVSPNGSILWSSGPVTSGTHLVDRIAIAPDGAVALRTGSLNGTAVVRRWNSAGVLTWTKTFEVPDQDTTVGSLIFDRFETLYVVFDTGARRFAPDGTELAPLAQAVPGVAARLQMTSTTLRSMFVGGVSPNFVRFEGSLDLATGTYTQSSNLGGAEAIPPGFQLPNFGFGISNNGHSGDADFYQLDNGTSQLFPMAFRINGAFDRKVYYQFDGTTLIEPFAGAVPRNIAYHRTSTASAQYVLSGSWSGFAWVQAFSD